MSSKANHGNTFLIIKQLNSNDDFENAIQAIYDIFVETCL